MTYIAKSFVQMTRTFLNKVSLLLYLLLGVSSIISFTEQQQSSCCCKALAHSTLSGHLIIRNNYLHGAGVRLHFSEAS